MTDPEKTSRISSSSDNCNAVPDSLPVDATTGKGLESQEQRIVVPPLQWNGPDDPDNPLNWPAWKKNWHVFTPALISFSAYVLFLFWSLFMSYCTFVINNCILNIGFILNFEYFQ